MLDMWNESPDSGELPWFWQVLSWRTDAQLLVLRFMSPDYRWIS